MRIALITPYYRDSVRGNSVTVRRVLEHLAKQGCEPELFPLDEYAEDDVVSRISDGRFDLCHAFHAYVGGRAAYRVWQRSRLPYLITLTGSDVYEALLDERRSTVFAALDSAAAVAAFHGIVGAQLIAYLPELAGRIVVIPQGVNLPPAAIISQEIEGRGDFTFLLPAGIRSVKNPGAPFAPLATLYERYPEIRLHLVGPVLDKQFAAHLFDRMADYPFVEYRGVIDHDDMGRLYRMADVVLNTSLFEGGMANALLEAMAWGKAVLAADIEGNRSLVTDGVTGLLYRDEADFVAKAEQLLNSEQLRRQLGSTARRVVELGNRPEKEAEAYLHLYQSILSV